MVDAATSGSVDVDPVGARAAAVALVPHPNRKSSTDAYLRLRDADQDIGRSGRGANQHGAEDDKRNEDSGQVSSSHEQRLASVHSQRNSRGLTEPGCRESGVSPLEVLQERVRLRRSMAGWIDGRPPTSAEDQP